MPKESVPYPPGPRKVPSGLTEYPESYKRQQLILVIGLMTFLAVYVCCFVGTVFIGALSLLLIPKIGLIGLPIAGLCLILFIIFLNGLFHTASNDGELAVPITEDEHPQLFAFIRKLCEEIGVEEPNAVLVSPEVNAAVITRTSLVNVVVPAKRDLLIGIGLVNGINLSEFKAVLAHEFGHFAQGGTINSYFYAVYRICYGIVVGSSGMERTFDEWRKSENGILMLIGLMLWVPFVTFRWATDQCFRLFAFLRHGVSREAEFHADLVAASVAGSNAITHLLYRAELASDSYTRALEELSKAADHKMYTADIFYHQTAVVPLMKKDRKKRKEEDKADRPELKSAKDGKKIRVFDPKTTIDPTTMGDYHPSNVDREENVKKRFVEAAEDDRPAWILFDEPEELRERVTLKMYRKYLRIKRNAKMEDPEVVQKFIDAEHQETTYGDHYHGAYDDRIIRPGDLELLDLEIRDKPWKADRIVEEHSSLYEGIAEKVTERTKTLEKLAKVRAKVHEMSKKKARTRIRELEENLEASNEWFSSLDCKVYQTHLQMVQKLGGERVAEYRQRYRFHLSIQRIFLRVREQFDEAEFALAYLTHVQSSGASPEDVGAQMEETLEVLKDARRTMKTILQNASEIDMPAMVNFTKGDNLSDFLLEETLIKEAYEFGVTGKWINKLFRQLGKIRERSQRLHFKSLGGILTLQETIAKEYLQPV